MLIHLLFVLPPVWHEQNMQILALDRTHNVDFLLRTKAEMASHLSYLVLLKAKHLKQINKNSSDNYMDKNRTFKKNTEFWMYI